MEDIGKDIEKELETKSIEREIEIKEVEVEDATLSSQAEEEEEKVPPLPSAEPRVKSKKVRSQKQMEAFEKARQKRAEAIALRKQQKEEDKIEKKEIKKELKKELSRATNVKKIAGEQSNDIVQEKSIPKPVMNTFNPPSQSQISSAQREQVIQNHYYYYGVPPPTHDDYTKSKKKKKSKRPPTPTSSESESSEEEYHEQLPVPQYYQPPKPTYKFSYA
tara:strand:+ start:136 stop:792 length:657 start_codon:yes stop_codon:yes gene_type:complete